MSRLFRLLAVLAALLLGPGCGPPQVGADREANRQVEALFTAVTARDEKLLARCEGRLADLKEKGKLPAPAHAELEKVISRARSGDWQGAARRLDGFIRGQKAEHAH